MKLKIHSSQSYIPPGKQHFVMLYPFWGQPFEDLAAPLSGRYDHYTETGSRFFEMTELLQADLAVLPVAWEHVGNNEPAQAQALEFAERARQAGKPVAIFFWSDSDEPVPIEQSFIFRTSFYRSTRRPNEFALPAWSEDFVAKYLDGRLPLRPKAEKPRVGFCGKAALKQELLLGPRIKQWLYNAAVKLNFKPKPITPEEVRGHQLRAEALDMLSENSLVETNFVIRPYFWSKLIPRDEEGIDQQVAQKLRREYVQNMVDSDYILCLRGAGNFSYRLYETLCCGRIPVFVDTDCVLPYDYLLDWRQYCVWVDEADLAQIAERVAEFHAALSAPAFEELQRACRRLWEEWLSPCGFFSNLYRYVEKPVISF